MFFRMIVVTVLSVFALSSCVEQKKLAEVITDPHSYANFEDVVVEHLHLDLQLDFEAKVMRGKAELLINNKGGAQELVLDTRQLTIDKVTLDDDGAEVEFVMGPAHPLEGSSLTIPINDSTKTVHIHYSTSPEAEALQWLDPEQTTGGTLPFLFSQNQPILARTWIPCQDSPAVRMTYTARVKTRPDVLVVMSAENPIEKSPDGEYLFTMTQPIPSYLIALAAGDLAFGELGPRSGVYAEPSVLDKAVYEFGDTEKMMDAAEALYGPYRWERYDILVLPPSFPFGGMENPRLTFATPTILAGDRSLNALVAHELAHSWSGNLVTNATWEDIWLNEGFTSYIENRIVEALYSEDYANMLKVLDYQKLQKELDRLGRKDPDTKLHVDLEQRDPDDGLSAIAYDKGHFFLYTLEKYFGREKWDAFLQKYFETFAFKPMTSAKFIDFAREQLVQDDIQMRQDLALHQWVYGPGLPENVAVPGSNEFARVDAQREVFVNGADAATLETGDWTTHHWLYFLRNLPQDLTPEQMADLDAAYGLTSHGNSEIQFAWLYLTVPDNYEPAQQAAEEFLKNVGRIKFVAPLFGAVINSDMGLEGAQRIYGEAKEGYHPLTRRAVEAVINGQGEESS